MVVARFRPGTDRIKPCPKGAIGPDFIDLRSAAEGRGHVMRDHVGTDETANRSRASSRIGRVFQRVPETRPGARLRQRAVAKPDPVRFATDLGWRGKESGLPVRESENFSPHPKSAIVSKPQGMGPLAASDGSPITVRADLHQVGGVRAGAIAQLAPRVIAPGPQGSIAPEGDRVQVAGGDSNPIRVRIDLCRNSAGLVVAAVAPFPDRPVGAETNTVIVGRKRFCPVAISSHLFRGSGSREQRPARLSPTPKRAVREDDEDAGDPRKNAQWRVGLIQGYDHGRRHQGRGHRHANASLGREEDDANDQCE